MATRQIQQGEVILVSQPLVIDGGNLRHVVLMEAMGRPRDTAENIAAICGYQLPSACRMEFCSATDERVIGVKPVPVRAEAIIRCPSCLTAYQQMSIVRPS